MDVIIYLAFILMLIGSYCIGYMVGRGAKHFDGLFIVDDGNFEKTSWTLDVKMDPRDVPNKKELRFKVIKDRIGDV